MAAKTVLYTMPISHYCVCAERLLAFKGIPFTREVVPYHDKQSLIAATRQDYVPALLHEGRTVSWEKIPEFAEALAPKPTLYPWGNRGLPEVLDNWGHQVLEERVWRAVVTRVPPVLPDERERWVFEEIQNRVRGPWHVLELRRPEFEAEMVSYLGMVERMLEGRQWLLGEPSLADFGVYGGMSPLFTSGGSVPSELSNLKGWIQRIGALGGSSSAAPEGAAGPGTTRLKGPH
ncbi:MAG: glutathione S-transferase family protein [Thermoplasmata archaeon]|nr:glutathione S-transferase family protein [Thermoplasmata archaeon]